MDVQMLREICLGMPGATEDIKWEKDLCYSIGDKLFCITTLEDPVRASLKVTPEDFTSLTDSPDIVPAPYIGRYKWIYVENSQRFSSAEWKARVSASYALVRSKLPKRIQGGLPHWEPA